MIRKSPHPLWYRTLLLRVAALLDGRVQAIRAHVKAHTPRRLKRMTATEIVQGAPPCTCPPSERPPTCQHKYALTDCAAAWDARFT